jgi:hypothetical protein
MKLSEAIIEFKMGRCTAFKRKDLIGTVYINKLEMFEFKDVCGDCSLTSGDILAEDWELVDPKPQYEEVEEVCYCSIDRLGKHHYSSFPFLPIEGCDQFKLTGKHKIEIKPKVKRRMFVGESVKNGIFTNYAIASVPPGSSIFAEWEE